jgi:hypothetical protein
VSSSAFGPDDLRAFAAAQECLCPGCGSALGQADGAACADCGEALQLCLEGSSPGWRLVLPILMVVVGSMLLQGLHLYSMQHILFHSEVEFIRARRSMTPYWANFLVGVAIMAALLAVVAWYVLACRGWGGWAMGRGRFIVAFVWLAAAVGSAQTILMIMGRFVWWPSP